MSGIKKKFAAGSLWLFIGQNFSNLASFIIFAVLARILGPLDFGIVAFASVFIDLSRSLALAGLPTALISASEWDEDTASTAFWGNVGFSIILAILVGGGGGYVLREYYGNELQWVISALSACLILDALRATHEAKLQREFQFKELAKRSALATSGAGVVGVILAFAGFGVWALVINRIANSAIQTIIIWHATPWSPHLVFRRKKFLEMFIFGMHLSTATVIGQVNRQVPELIAGLLISPVAVGYFRIASRMVNMLYDLTTTPLRRTAIASFSRLKDTAARVRGYRTVTRAIALAAFPMFFGVAALADDLVVLVVGEKWAQSAFIMSMLALVGGIASVSFFVQPLLATDGQARTGAINSLQILLANILVCLITAPFGITALAIGFAIRAYLGVIPTLLLLQRSVGLPPSKVVKDIFPSFLCAAVMILVILTVHVYVLMDYSRLVRLVILVPLGAIAYTSMLAIFFRTFLREIWRDLEPLLSPALQRLTKR